MKHLIFSAVLACGCVAMGVEPEVMLRDNFEFCEPGPGVPAGHELFFGTKLTGDAAKNTKTSVSVVAKEKGRDEISLYLGELEKSLSGRLGRKVTISHHGKKGKVQLEYYSSEDLEVLLTLLDQQHGEGADHYG